MVSNCHTDSKREELVDALRNLPPPGNLQIDIYGKCGSRSRSLPPSTSSTIGKFPDHENPSNLEHEKFSKKSSNYNDVGKCCALTNFFSK